MYSEPIGDQWKYNPEYHRVAEFLGIDRFKREDFDVAQKISFIRDYLDMNGKINTVEGVLTKLHEFKKKIGSNDQGETLVRELYQHARLDADRRKLDAVTPKVQAPAENKAQKKVEKKPDINIKDVVTQTIEGVIQGVMKQATSAVQPQKPQEAQV